jgi:hypothetical protein
MNQYRALVDSDWLGKNQNTQTKACTSTILCIRNLTLTCASMIRGLQNAMWAMAQPNPEEIISIQWKPEKLMFICTTGMLLHSSWHSFKALDNVPSKGAQQCTDLQRTPNPQHLFLSWISDHWHLRSGHDTDVEQLKVGKMQCCL